jgi:hypothetical protein
VSHPDGLPDLFLDRSLGRVRVPALLRAAGLRLVTLSERYGIPTDETVPDHQWLSDAGERGEAVFMKDARIRYQPAEKAALVAGAVRCFCLTGGNLSGDDMAACFLANLDAITAACAEAGPFIYAVQRRRIERLALG